MNKTFRTTFCAFCEKKFNFLHGLTVASLYKYKIFSFSPIHSSFLFNSQYLFFSFRFVSFFFSLLWIACSNGYIRLLIDKHFRNLEYFNLKFSSASGSFVLVIGFYMRAQKRQSLFYYWQQQKHRRNGERMWNKCFTEFHAFESIFLNLLPHAHTPRHTHTQ